MMKPGAQMGCNTTEQPPPQEFPNLPRHCSSLPTSRGWLPRSRVLTPERWEHRFWGKTNFESTQNFILASVQKRSIKRCMENLGFFKISILHPILSSCTPKQHNPKVNRSAGRAPLSLTLTIVETKQLWIRKWQTSMPLANAKPPSIVLGRPQPM